MSSSGRGPGHVVDDEDRVRGRAVPSREAGVFARLRWLAQSGDAGRLGLADRDEPPLRWVAGEDAVAAGEQKARLLLTQVDTHRELSTDLSHDDAHSAA